MSSRIDPQGYSTRVTSFPDGFGLRVLRHGQVIMQDRVSSKADISKGLKGMLRLIDKCGNPSDMASASRDRQK